MSRSTRRTFLKASAAFGAGFAIAGTKASGPGPGRQRHRPHRRGRHPRPRRDPHRRIRRDEERPGHLPDRPRQPAVRQSPRHRSRRRAATRPSAFRTSARPSTTRTWTPSPSPRRNHWHSLMTIWACQAGKDVYVEKPCSHNVFEGRNRRRGRREVRPHRPARHPEPLQHAAGPTSGRPSPAASTASCWSPRATATSPAGASASSRTPRAAAGTGLTTSGSAPRRSSPTTKTCVHYNWHWFWDFGNGDIGNQGVHQMDIARWGIPGGHAAQERRQPRRPLRLSRTRARRPTPQSPSWTSATPSSSSRSADWRPTTTTARRSATSSTSKGGIVTDNAFYPDGKKEKADLPECRGQPGPRRRPLRQLHRRGPQPQPQGPERRHPRRPLLRRPLPPAEHLLPPRRGRPLQHPDQGLRRLQGHVRNP